MGFQESRELRLAIGISQESRSSSSHGVDLSGPFPTPSLPSGSGVVNSARAWYQSCGPFLPGQAELSVYRILLASYEYFDKSS